MTEVINTRRERKVKIRPADSILMGEEGKDNLDFFFPQHMFVPIRKVGAMIYIVASEMHQSRSGALACARQHDDDPFATHVPNSVAGMLDVVLNPTKITSLSEEEKEVMNHE